MRLQIKDFDDMFSSDSYEKLGNLSYRKSISLPSYTLTITVCCYVKNRNARIRVLLTNEFIRISKTYMRDFTPNLMSKCKKIEKAFSGMLFLKDFHSLLKRIEVKND